MSPLSGTGPLFAITEISNSLRSEMRSLGYGGRLGKLTGDSGLSSVWRGIWAVEGSYREPRNDVVQKKFWYVSNFHC